MKEVTLTVALFLVGLNAAIAQDIAYDDLEAIPLQELTQLGQLKQRSLREVSGLAYSKKHKEVIWAINDGGNGETLFALNPKGEVLAEIKVDQVKNWDWEDLDTFTVDGESYLMIADVGDNRAIRKKPMLLLFKEPELTVKSITPINTTVVAYEDGARDCEAVAVDTELREVLLVSKRDIPPGVYTVPLALESKPPGEETIVTAKKRSVVDALPQPDFRDLKEKYGVYSSQPTAIDIEGNRLLMLTYKYAYLYERQSDQHWSDVMLKKPKLLKLRKLEQQEAVTWLPDGNGIIYTSEGRLAPVMKAAW